MSKLNNITKNVLIIQMLQSFLIYSYVVDVASVLYWKFFLQPIALVYAITISIYSYLTVFYKI